MGVLVYILEKSKKLNMKVGVLEVFEVVDNS